MDAPLEWNATVSRIYREAVANSGADGIDRQTAYDTAVARIARLIHNGSLVLPLEKAIRAELDKADGRDSRSADAVLRRVLSGEQSLFTETGDPVLDLIVTLGKGRRKAWRDVTAADVAEMTELRQGNMRSTILSFEAWRNDSDAAMPVLLAHGTIGAAVEAGAFKGVEVAA